MNHDQYLKKKMGFWSLTAVSLGGIIGSGWLFGAAIAANKAGPESIISWVIGGIAMMLVGLVYAELGMVKPESGGVVRYPLYSNGSLVASLTGFSLWLGYVANPPTEASGIVQYASQFWPGLYDKVGGHLSLSGIMLSVLIMALFVILNYFGVKLFSIANNIITTIKFIVPSLTILTFFMTGFHSENFTSHGFAPYGWGAGLSAIATSGIIFAYTGFQNSVLMGGEVVNPKRNIPLSIICSIAISIVLYVLIEIVFIGAVPTKMLAIGWHGVQFNSPFADLALSINIMWLYWALMADSMISPAGASLSFTAANARNVFGLAKNGFLPNFFANVNMRYGIPTRALILNFLVGLFYLVPLKSWESIVSITGALAVYTFCAGCVSAIIFRKVGWTKNNGVRGMQIIAPLAFIISTLIIYWSGWHTLSFTIWALAIGIAWYLISYFVRKEKPIEFVGGIWMIVYLIVVLTLSSLGGFGGAGIIPDPWMSIILSLASLAIYYFAVFSGVWYMNKNAKDLSQESSVNEKVSGI